MKVRQVRREDAARIAAIYNPYILTTCITFEEQAVSGDEMQRRIATTLKEEMPWLVCEDNDEIVGYAYAHQWSARSAYRYSVEPSVYVAKDTTGHGVGKMLYQALLDELRQRSKRNVVGVIALPNNASIRLHEALGFKKVGELADVGYKQGRWCSVGFWQLQLSD